MTSEKTFKNAAEAAERLEELIREARGALGDIRKEIKQAKKVLKKRLGSTYNSKLLCRLVNSFRYSEERLRRLWTNLSIK